MPSLPISTNFKHACRLDTLKFVDFVLGCHKVSRLSSFCRAFDALDANIRLWISQEIVKWSLPWDFRIWEHHLKRKKKKVQSQGFQIWRLTSNFVYLETLYQTDCKPIACWILSQSHQLPTGAALLQRLDGDGRSGQPGAEKKTLRWGVWFRDRYARWGTGRYK